MPYQPANGALNLQNGGPTSESGCYLVYNRLLSVKNFLYLQVVNFG